MNTKSISQNALDVIARYRNFIVNSAVCTVPYYHNRRRQARAKLRAQIGKGSPEDISEEVEDLIRKEKIETKNKRYYCLGNYLDSNWIWKFLDFVWNAFHKSK